LGVRIRRAAPLVLPWVAFLAMMAWAWGWRDLRATLPNHGDAFETVVGASWFSDALAHSQNPLVYPYNFFPVGWRVGSHSAGIILYLMLWPVARLGGPALAYNLPFLALTALAFGGAYLLARRHMGLLAATTVALAITFWGLRWHQAIGGRLQIYAASACLPWMLWCVERAYARERRRYVWLGLAGAAWALAFSLSLYFVFIGGAALAIWVLFAPGPGDSRPGTTVTWRTRWLGLGVVCAVFLALGAPWLLFNSHETALASPAFYSIDEVAVSGASLNSFAVPSLFHPWLGGLARRLYRGEPWEQGAANLGLAWCAAAVAGFIAARGRDRARWAMAALACAGLALALGLTLHWDGRALQVGLLRPLNEAIWQVGHALKPGFFNGPSVPATFAESVPLPAMWLALAVPFLERGRIFARFALAASLGVYLLGGLALERVRGGWPNKPYAGLIAQVLIAGVLLFEIVPPRLASLPYPPAGHSAYTWLSEQDLHGEGIANVMAAHSSTLVLSINGYNLLAPDYHRQATAAGASGVVPRHTAALNEWLATHEHPFWQPDLAQILRAYGVRYVVMEMLGPWEQGLWREAQAARDFKPVKCFPPPPTGTLTPWSWPICIVEVPPPPSPDFNVLLHDGWSGREGWGVWAEGTESAAQWVATTMVPQRLSLSAFPLCVPGKRQEITLEANGVAVARHAWSDCEPWEATIDLPAEQVRVGLNDLVLRSAYAEAPQEGDTRRLAVGVTKFLVRGP